MEVAGQTLVSNHSQTDGTAHPTHTSTALQAITTGSHPARYMLGMEPWNSLTGQKLGSKTNRRYQPNTVTATRGLASPAPPETDTSPPSGDNPTIVG